MEAYKEYLEEEDVAEYVDVDYAALEAEAGGDGGCAGCIGCLLPAAAVALGLGILLLLLLN